jgi:hypothetical protein
VNTALIDVAMTSPNTEEVMRGLVEALTFPRSKSRRTVGRFLLRRIPLTRQGNLHLAEFIARKAFYAHPMKSPEQVIAWDAYFELLRPVRHERLWKLAEMIAQTAYRRSGTGTGRESRARRAYWGLFRPVLADGQVLLAKMIAERATWYLFARPELAAVQAARVKLKRQMENSANLGKMTIHELAERAQSLTQSNERVSRPCEDQRVIARDLV